jgi:6,7-dimethyl-8-ribityllumazine synthase
MSTARFLIITSRFNEDITARLTQGARDTLLAEGVKQENITELSVPGAFELPAVAAKAAASGKWQAILCLGSLIQGETDHYHYICDAVANGLTSVGIQYKMPVLFGVLTTSDKEQALARASFGEKAMGLRVDGKIIVHNKGQATALAALMTLRTLGELDGLAV